MLTIDFTNIYEASGNRIKEAYHIWTGSGFASYAKEGVSGDFCGECLRRRD
jgi:hypothetical protein